VTTISTPGTRYATGAHSEPGELPSAVSASARSRLLALLIVLGVAVRAWAYFSNVSLWLDELLLSRNILGLPLSHLLTKPLLLDQVAPRGFLLLEKLAVDTLGRNELALRFFPFLCSVASVFLFHRLAKRALGGWAAVLALLLFAIGVPFIQYGVEVKQYIFDATAAMLLLYLALTLRDPDATTRRLVLTGLAAFVIICFSQASVVVMAGIGAALAVEWLIGRDRRTARALVITIPIWAVAALVAILAGLRSMTPSTREFMEDFWGTGFMPLPFTPTGTLRWLWAQWLSLFTDPTLLRYPLPLLFVTLSLLGIVSLWHARRDVALILLGPFALAVLAAAAHQYPLRGRLMFYLAPGVLLVIAAGVEQLRRWAGALRHPLGVVVAVAVLTPPTMAFVKGHPPYEIENNRALYAYLQHKRQPGDVVHIFPLSRIGALYYGERYGLRLGDWKTAVCDRNETRAFVRDVDQYRGVRRLWLVSGGSRPYRSARAAVRDYLATIGVRRDSLFLPSLSRDGVWLDLYDLSDTVRLGSADAETFPVAPMSKDPRPGCRPFVKPSPLDSLR
jgi:dolichyl-phosphate-mannose-protein mannosyltransferase